MKIFGDVISVEELVDNAFESRDKFADISGFVVDNYAEEQGEDAKVKLISDLALGLAMGEEIGIRKTIPFLKIVVVAGPVLGLATGVFIGRKTKKNCKSKGEA